MVRSTEIIVPNTASTYCYELPEEDRSTGYVCVPTLLQEMTSDRVLLPLAPAWFANGVPIPSLRAQALRWHNGGRSHVESSIY